MDGLNIIRYPARGQWTEIICRNGLDNTHLFDLVRVVLDDIRNRGDQAVKEYGLKFDQVQLNDLEVSPEEKTEAVNQLPKKLKKAIEEAKKNIEKFHIAQKHDFQKIETAPGVWCWQKASAIEKVGLYIPGGTAPLFSTVLMLAIPAKIAGCQEIVLCTPPNSEGKIHPAILFAAETAGINRIFKIGGIQAIGAMTYGTDSVPNVYKIFGPGNQYVTAAKQWVSLKDVAID